MAFLRIISTATVCASAELQTCGASEACASAVKDTVLLQHMRSMRTVQLLDADEEELENETQRPGVDVPLPGHGAADVEKPCELFGRDDSALCGVTFLADEVEFDREEVRQRIREQCPKYYDLDLCNRVAAELFKDVPEDIDVEIACTEVRDLIKTHWCHRASQLSDSVGTTALPQPAAAADGTTVPSVPAAVPGVPAAVPGVPAATPATVAEGSGSAVASLQQRSKLQHHGAVFEDFMNKKKVNEDPNNEDLQNIGGRRRERRRRVD